MNDQNDPELYGEINNVTMYASYDNNDGYCFYRSGSALVTKCEVYGDISALEINWMSLIILHMYI